MITTIFDNAPNCDYDRHLNNGTLLAFCTYPHTLYTPVSTSNSTPL
jgi:hypothetical protein